MSTSGYWIGRVSVHPGTGLNRLISDVMSETMAATTAHSAEQPNEQEYILPETASDGSPTNAPRRPDLHLSSDVRPRSSSDAATAAAISTGRIRSSSFTEAAVRSPVRVRQSPQRRVLIAIDGSQGSKNAFDCKLTSWYVCSRFKTFSFRYYVKLCGFWFILCVRHGRVVRGNGVGVVIRLWSGVLVGNV